MGRTADVTFFSRSDGREHTARDLTLFYVVQGSAELQTPEHRYRLEHEDLMVLNPSETYTLRIHDGVTACITFHHEEVYALLKGKLRQVHCCSVQVRDGSYNALRFEVQAVLGTLLEKEYGAVAFERNCCTLLLSLLSRYYQPNSAQDRRQEVAQWVENTSREPVTLEDAAEHFHLTPQYFSRWFASAFSCTFLKYLSQVRCQKAKKDLLEGDSSILRIAMDQGFPNAASFTRAFSELYGETPLQYRKSHSARKREGVLSAQEVQPYLSREQEEKRRRIHEVRIDCDGLHPRLKPYWNELCCLGSLSALADLEVQEQVRELQQEFHFRYARLFLRRTERSNFFREDKAMSFLHEVGLTPLFVVEYDRFHGVSDYFPWLKELLRHLLHRFGLRTVHMELLLDSDFHREEANQYRSFVTILRSQFHSLQMDCVLYGPGLRLSSDGENLSRCLRAKPDLDRISIRCAPAEIVSSDELPVRSAPEPDFLLHQYRLGQEILNRHDWKQPLLLTGWRTSLGSGNVLNDSSWMAARIVQTALTGYGNLPSLPMDCPLDVLQEGATEEDSLHGRPGLMTLNRLHKPSFYALRFLTHQDEYLLYSDEHLLVSASADGYLQIVLQNSSDLSYQYYLHDQDLLKRRVPIPHTFYESNAPYQVRLRLTGVPEGRWMMKTRIVNDSVGNVFNAWLSLNYNDDSFLGRDELALLRAKSLPDIRGNTLSARNGVLDVPITLGPNEIRHIHLLLIR